jgi:hypothetical protein
MYKKFKQATFSDDPLRQRFNPSLVFFPAGFGFQRCFEALRSEGVTNSSKLQPTQGEMGARKVRKRETQSSARTEEGPLVSAEMLQ